MNYQELKAKQSREMNKFQGIFFAFSDSQFLEGMNKVGLTLQDKDKIVNIGAGGFILKNRVDDFKAMINSWHEERNNLKKEERNLIEALVYELGNHEYCITGDVTDALNALDLTIDTVDHKTLKKAIFCYNKGLR